MYWVLLVQFYYQTIQSPSLKTITNHHGFGQSYVMLSRLHTHWINPSSTYTGNAIWQFYYSTGQTIMIHRNNINHSKTYIQIKSNSTSDGKIMLDKPHLTSPLATNTRKSKINVKFTQAKMSILEDFPERKSNPPNQKIKQRKINQEL